MKGLGLNTMDKIWDVLSDNKIKKMLANSELDIDEHTIRLLLIEMLSRIKDLELQNFTLRAVLLENNLVEEQKFNNRLSKAKKYIKEKDNEKERSVEFFSKTGISFVEWASFSNLGSFKKDN